MRVRLQNTIKEWIGNIIVIHSCARAKSWEPKRNLVAYQKEGVEFIPLSEAVKDDVYNIDPAVVTSSGIEFTYQVLKSRGLQLKDIGLTPYDGLPEKRLKTVCR